MRIGLSILCGLACTAGLLAAAEDPKPTVRYSVAVDLKTYPQGAPKEALASVLKAADAGKFDYLSAQLADPTFIDDRVKSLFAGNFDEQVKDTHARLDPPALKQLHRFLDDGEWTTDETTASVRLKDIGDRAVFFRRIDGRWYLEHRSKPKT
jgi:HEAT repeat protein